MTKSEEQVMNLLWHSDKPLSCTEIIELSADKTWKDSYVHAMIKSLIKKDIVKIASFELISRGYSRLFAPKVNYAEYVLMSSYTEEELRDSEKMIDLYRAFLFLAGSEKVKEYIQNNM